MIPPVPQRASSSACRGVLLAVLALALPAAGGLARADAAPAAPHSSSRQLMPVVVTRNGAVADDGKDDLAAFRAAVRKARARDTWVSVPPGTFELSDTLVLDGVVLVGSGRRATTITSTDPHACSIVLTGADAGLGRLHHRVATPARRTGQLGTQNVLVQDAQHFVVDRLDVDGATGAGVMVRHSTHGVVSRSYVHRTGADGVHLTDGSSEVTVVRNRVSNVTDDAIAVVSYQRDSATTSHVRVLHNRVDHGRTRGLSVVGGRQVLIAGNRVAHTALAGVYVATEGAEWKTRDTADVTISRNVVTDAATATSSGHTSMLVYASKGSVDDVHFDDNVVDASPTEAFGVWRKHVAGVAYGTVGDVWFVRNTVSDAANGATRFLAGTLHLVDNEGF